MTTDIGRITVPAHDCIGGFTATITVTGLRRFNVRCWIGLRLLELAAWILPFRTDIEVKP